jgi:ABC-type dipeptide/oligopeptide/nickel transport system ATPase component
MSSAPLLSVRISADYRGKTGVLRDCAFDVRRGEILGLVGESGCGKSTLALALLRLLSLKSGSSTGTALLNNRDLMILSEREMRALRGKDIGLVLQSPMSSLNPALRISRQLEEAWRVHASGPRDQCHVALLHSLETVSLPPEEDFLRRYPSQLSVGQAQRVLIAMAVMHRPSLVIADEPTSALDIITQAEILNLFRDLSLKLQISILFISHDLLSVATISDRVAVMSQGQIVECRSTREIFSNPQHPYTRQLIKALPALPNFALTHTAAAQAGGRS